MGMMLSRKIYVSAEWHVFTPDSVRFDVGVVVAAFSDFRGWSNCERSVESLP